jgi:hypothetical protein
VEDNVDLTLFSEVNEISWGSRELHNIRSLLEGELRVVGGEIFCCLGEKQCLIESEECSEFSANRELLDSDMGKSFLWSASENFKFFHTLSIDWRLTDVCEKHLAIVDLCINSPEICNIRSFKFCCRQLS